MLPRHYGYRDFRQYQRVSERPAGRRAKKKRRDYQGKVGASRDMIQCSAYML